jgi:AraC family transcriptional regulator
VSADERIPRPGVVPGQETSPEPVAPLSRRPKFAVARFKLAAQEPGTLVSSPLLDGFGMSIFLADFPAFDLTVDGHNIRTTPMRSGEFQLSDLKSGIAAHLTRSIDLVHFTIPRDVLKVIADECGLSSLETLHLAPGVGIADAVVKNIGFSLLPLLGRIEQANRLFLDHVGTALLIHLAHTYGGIAQTPQQEFGELAPWQHRRAEDMIVARLDGEITASSAHRAARRAGTGSAAQFGPASRRDCHVVRLRR